MEQLKKTFFILVIGLLVVGSGVGGFYLIKKYTSPQYPKTPIPQEVILPGFVRDSEMKIPAVFPKGLVLQDDVKTPLESFSQTKDNLVQTTFKYISNKDRNENFFAFNDVLFKAGWKRESTTRSGGARNVRYTLFKNSINITYDTLENLGDMIDITLVTNKI